MMFMPNHTTYRVVDYAGLKDCDVIVNAVGDITICRSFNRDDELSNSVRQVADYVPKVMAAGFDGIFVNITNPCDVITRLIARKSGLPKAESWAPAPCWIPPAWFISCPKSPVGTAEASLAS